MVGARSSMIAGTMSAKWRLNASGADLAACFTALDAVLRTSVEGLDNIDARLRNKVALSEGSCIKRVL